MANEPESPAETQTRPMPPASSRADAELERLRQEIRNLKRLLSEWQKLAERIGKVLGCSSVDIEERIHALVSATPSERAIAAAREIAAKFDIYEMAEWSGEDVDEVAAILGRHFQPEQEAGPCSPCGDGDTAQRYHSHATVPTASESDGIRAYVDSYECRDDDSVYTPNDHERLLIEDALRGWTDRGWADSKGSPTESDASLLAETEAIETRYQVHTGYEVVDVFRLCALLKQRLGAPVGATVPPRSYSLENGLPCDECGKIATEWTIDPTDNRVTLRCPEHPFIAPAAIGSACDDAVTAERQRVREAVEGMRFSWDSEKNKADVLALIEGENNAKT